MAGLNPSQETSEDLNADGVGGPGTERVAKRAGVSETCFFCDLPPVALLRDPDRRLCADHYIRDCEERVRTELFGDAQAGQGSTGRLGRAGASGGLIAPGDRIAVGLSGGKDSTALLILLTDILSSRRDVSIAAVTVDEGIRGYREETMQAAADLVQRLGVPHTIVSFADLYGSDLDSLLGGRERQACTVCGVLRRRALLEGARRVQATKIATGHNRDDEAQSVLMNLLRGDLFRLVMDTSSGYPDCFIPRIKPLAPLSEKEIAIYLMLRGAFLELPECPYAHTALRGEVREILLALESCFPGTTGNLIRSQKMIRESIPVGTIPGTDWKQPGDDGGAICRICGEITTGSICSVCRVLGKDRNDHNSGVHSG